MNGNSILALLPVQYLAYATAAVTISSALVSVLPAPKNMRTGYSYIWRALDYIALNFANGKTATKAVAQGEAVRLPPPSVSSFRGPGSEA